MSAGCAIGLLFKFDPIILLPLLMMSFSFWISPVLDDKPKNVLFSFFVGIMLVSLTAAKPPDQLWQNSGSKLKITGIVYNIRENTTNRSVFDLEITESNPESAKGCNARCYTKPNQKLAVGSVVSFTAYSKKPSSATNPGEFDFAAYLQSNDFSLMLSSFETPVILSTRTSAQTVFQSFRQDMDEIYENNLPPRYSDLLDSMVFGKKELPEDLVRNFTRTGTSHIVAASGFNISIIAFSSYFLMLWISGNRKSALIGSIVFTIVYAFLAGFTPSVTRAMLMAILTIISQLTSRKHDTASGLAMALIILLAVNPLWIEDAGFQLSFISTFCLFVIAPVVFRIESKKSWHYKIFSMLIISLSIQLLTLPILATRFHAFSTISPVANLIVLPITSVLTPIGALAAILGLVFPFLGLILCYIALPMLVFMDKAIELLASPTWSLVSVGTLPFFAWIYYYISCGLCLLLFTKNRHAQTRYAKIAFVIAIAFFSMNFAGTAIGSGNCDSSEVTFLDVGQGDSVFIKTRLGKTLLIDGGGGAPYLPSGDTGKRIVIPFLRSKGINSIDYVIATHRDQDHIGGLASVIRDFPVGTVYDSGIKSDTYESTDFEKTVNLKNISTKTPSVLEKLTIDNNSELIFLGVPNPLIPAGNNSSATNNNSVACIISIDGVKVLLGADIQTEAMVRQLQMQLPIKADILKIPHHGGYSQGFSSWLEAVGPKLAINSDSSIDGSGMDSRIENIFERLAIPVVSTARNGALTITIKNGQWSVASYLKQKKASI